MIVSGHHCYHCPFNCSLFFDVQGSDEMLYFSPPSLYHIIYTLSFHSICLEACNWFTASHLLFHLFIWLCRVSGVARWMFCCGIWNLVTWLGIEPGPLHWEHGILATGPPEKSQLIGFSSLSLTLWVLRM